MVTILATRSKARVKQRKLRKGVTSAPVTFGPSISPVSAITAGPVVLSGGNSTYTFTQSTAATTWTVAHNLARKPHVSVRTPGGIGVLTPDIQHLNANTLQLTFDIPFAGEAYCS